MGGRVGLLVVAVAVALPACASRDDGTPRWHCWFSADPAVCRCYFVSDADLSDMGYPLGEWTRDECPVADYLCCESGRAPEHIAEGDDACACANPRSTVYCRGDYPIVARCP